MPEIIKPTWNDLEEVVRSAADRLLVCSPFYSAEGVERVFDSLTEGVSLHFWTRLSPSDWASRVSDPDQLLILLSTLQESGVEIRLGYFNRLHAKAYAADKNLILLGSQNLSEGGFGVNLEAAVRFRDCEADGVIDSLENICLPSLRSVSLEQLQTWIEESYADIQKIREETVEPIDIIGDVQHRLDEILALESVTSRSISEPSVGDMADFVEWLYRNESLSGAEMLIRRHDNLDGHNLNGHFKQTFFGSMRFFSEYPQLREAVSAELDHLRSEDVYQMDTPNVLESWITHLEDHAMDSGEFYSYSTLRGILPPSVGGTRQGGGGGVGTIKRMLPLVARFILENES